jgi:chaperonin GroES
MTRMNNFWHSYLSSANTSIKGRGRLSRPQKEVPMKFRPLHDRVVIRRAESDTKSKGGIIIPDNAKEKPQEGEVIAVGPGARDESGKLIPLDVKAGDFILFGKWSGTEVKIDGEDLLIMKEADIMGIIDKSEMGIIDKSGAAKKAA